MAGHIEPRRIVCGLSVAPDLALPEGRIEMSRKGNRQARLAEAAQEVTSAAKAGAPGWTRTSDPRLRRPVLYPPELRAHDG